MTSSHQNAKIGIVGTGFMAKGITASLQSSGLGVSRVLTRRAVDEIVDSPLPHALTNELDELIEESDLIVECSGDAIHATDVTQAAFDAHLPVVTLNSEFQITTGSWFVGKGLITEAEGDQPGCLAALRVDALEMGFHPLVYGNIKGFLNHTPTREDMEYWSSKQGTSLGQTTSFTDGTKVQIEQAFAANAFGADIYGPGLLGPKSDCVESAGDRLAELAYCRREALADFVVCPGCPGVFITATHSEANQPYLSYLKMGEGPFYTLKRNYHLCHLEVGKTVHKALEAGSILMDNGTHPRISVNAIAKYDLHKGQMIESGIGSFELRGEAVRILDCPGHLPIGLIRHARLKRSIGAGEILSLSDVELPESLALRLWNEIVDKVVSQAGNALSACSDLDLMPPTTDAAVS